MVATDILGVCGRLMLEALCAGVDGPEAMGELARGRMRARIPELRVALTGRFTAHHAFLTRLHLQVIDGFDKAIAELEVRIEVVMEPFRPLLDLLLAMPGIGEWTAQVAVAEAGAVIDCFPSAECFASWAGLAPGSNQSGPKTKPAGTRHGNTYLKGALGIAAMSVSRSRGTFLSARYHRIAARRGPMRALVATEHSMAAAMWHMLTQGVCPTSNSAATTTPVATPNVPRPASQLRRKPSGSPSPSPRLRTLRPPDRTPPTDGTATCPRRHRFHRDTREVPAGRCRTLHPPWLLFIFASVTVNWLRGTPLVILGCLR